MPETTKRRSLEAHRRRQLLTIRALAERAQVNAGTIVDIEHGRTVPRFQTMQKIAAALDIEPLEVAEFAQAIEGDTTGKAAA